MKRGLYVMLVLMLIPAQSHACITTKEQMQEWFKKQDENNDQKLSQTEYFSDRNISAETQQKHFAEVDTDKNGTISFEEYYAYQTGPGRQKCH